MTTPINPPTIQIAIDAADPHLLARFWAAAVGYDVEDHHDLVVEMLRRGFASDDETIEIDGRKAWREAAACADPDGTGPRLLFQTVPEPKTVKDRIHLDLHFPTGEAGRDDEVARLVELGATKLYDGQLGPQRWVTMADPEGNEFCVG